MPSKTAQEVFNKLEPSICDLGYELCDVEYIKKNNGMNLTLFITSPTGITIDDCEKVHRFVDPILEELDPTNSSPYILNVSSLGLDRPIKSDKDFNRNLGKDVVVKLFASLSGKKEFFGKLKQFDKQQVCLDVSGEELIIMRSNIALCQLKIEF